MRRRSLLRWTSILVLHVGVGAVAADEPPGPANPPPSPEPAAQLGEADALDARAVALYRAGKYDEAVRLARESLALREMVLGKDHRQVAVTLNNLGAFLEAQGAYAEARPILERALAIDQRALGAEHPDVATDLSNLASLLCVQGAHEEARRLFGRALAIDEKALGTEHPGVATDLNNLAQVLHAQGAYLEERPLLERALAIDEKAQGVNHLAVARDLNNLAQALQARGSYAEARPLLERALSIRERALGKDHPDVSLSLNSLAVLLYSQGAYDDARPLYERALAIRERAFGKDHRFVANSLNNLAALLMAQGAYSAARPLYERALAIRETSLGRDHPDVAQSLGNLAQLLALEGAYAHARPLLERALAIQQKTLGPDHPAVATSLNRLASLLWDQGAYEESKRLYERSIAILERALGRDHEEVATVLGNLASVHYEQGAYADARPLLERALAIAEKALGADHPLVATHLNNLGELLRAQGAYEEARPLLERALAIRKRVLGNEAREVATSLSNLALLLRDQGDDEDARPLLERALEIDERALGKDHPNLATDADNLGRVLYAEGARAEAERLFQRSLALTERQMREGLAALSPRQRLALVRSVRLRLDNWLRFSSRLQLSGYAEAIRFRGLVARAETAERALTRRATGDQRATLDALLAATRLAARLANETPDWRKPGAGAAWQERYAKAAAERERLSREVTSRVASARTALERLDLTEADVHRALPSDTALVDLLRVGDRYLAWVLRSTGEAVRLDLGAASAIDQACEAFVAAIGEDSAEQVAVRAAGASLAALVWAPLRAALGEGAQRLVVCPDAALASIPFAALPGREPGRTLLDEHAISYVFHPFDLVLRKDTPAVGAGAVLVGGVDFDTAEGEAAGTPEAERPPVLESPDRAPRGRSFVPLPGTRAEVSGLKERFGHEATTLLQGPQATEARLREAVKGKRVVHLATHGFSRDDLLAGLYDRKIEQAFLSADAERQLGAGHDPMLLSGLALAGANPRDGAGGDDGVLTALEASYLDLDGVDLVTLSACETAKGTPESGEGVLGLVSAFQMAGARDVLASLWKVDDDATRLLMEGVYERILRRERPLSPAEALREAALALRDRKDPATGKARFASPRYWAAFVAYGG